jgi:hypothetical protein
MITIFAIYTLALIACAVPTLGIRYYRQQQERRDAENKRKRQEEFNMLYDTWVAAQRERLGGY